MIVNAGLKVGDAILLPASQDQPKKHIYLFSDHHLVGTKPLGEYSTNAKPSLSEIQHDEFIEALEETEEFRANKPLTIYYEHFNKLSIKPHKSLLGFLEKSIKKANLANIEAIDAEVRRYTGAAQGIFHDIRAGSSLADCSYFDGMKTLNEISFEDVINEFHNLVDELTTFQKHYNENWFEKGPFKGYNDVLMTAQEELKELESFLVSNTISLHTKVLEFAISNETTEELNSQLYDLIHSAGCEFLDLMLLKNILECENSFIAIIAGAAHTGQVHAFLEQIGANTINTYQSDCFSSALLSKTDILGIFKEYTLFQYVLKTTTNGIYTLTQKLLSASCMKRTSQRALTENISKKNIAILTAASFVCILISISKNSTNIKGVLYEESTKTNSTITPTNYKL